MNTDRDRERVEWNQALASGDPARIETERDRILAAVHTRIMNDEPAYQAAGWK